MYITRFTFFKHSYIKLVWLQLLAVLLATNPVAAQKLSNAIIKFNNTEHDYGKVELANSLISKFIITNAGSAKLYVLKADAASDYKISITKRAIMPGDTATLIVAYQPRVAGIFSQTIQVFTNAEAQPAEIFIKGELKKLDDDKTRCYYFDQPEKRKKEEMVSIPLPPAAKTDKPVPDRTHVVTDTAVALTSQLPLSKYKPNHIIFLIDVSRSMRDTQKLPLLKYAIEKLINALRSVDYLSLITYNDSAKLVGAYLPATERADIIARMDPIKANGRTNGSRGIRAAHKVAVDYFKEGVNNQIILATDGAFVLSDSDYKLFTGSDKKIIMSVIGFGDDKKFLFQLDELAKKCDGHYIHIANKEACNTALLDEIKQNSAR